jgi:hypothetical protein
LILNSTNIKNIDSNLDKRTDNNLIKNNESNSYSISRKNESGFTKLVSVPDSSFDRDFEMPNSNIKIITKNFLKFEREDIDQIDKNKIDTIVDITNTVLKEAFYSFPVFQGKLNENVVITDITSLLKDDMRDRLSKIVEKAANGPDGNGGLGLAQLCNSYYYRRDGYPQCNDPLNKTGTQPIVKGPFDCGIGKTISHSIDIDNYPYGYHCICGDGSIYEYSDVKDVKGEKPNKCFVCTKPGEAPENKDDKKCCVYYTKRTKSNPETKVGLNPNGTCYHFNITDDLARNHQDSYDPNYSCQGRNDCPGNLGCGYMDDYDNDKDHKVCCPTGMTWSGEGSQFYSDWCDSLDSGMRCKHDFQCKNGTCKDGKCN